MSNKLPFKLKSSSTKRKISSPSSNPSTATNSQSSVGAQKHESSIDDPIVNEEIKSLRVTEEQLREVNKKKTYYYYLFIYFSFVRQLKAFHSKKKRQKYLLRNHLLLLLLTPEILKSTFKKKKLQ